VNEGIPKAMFVDSKRWKVPIDTEPQLHAVLERLRAMMLNGFTEKRLDGSLRPFRFLRIPKGPEFFYEGIQSVQTLAHDPFESPNFDLIPKPFLNGIKGRRNAKGEIPKFMGKARNKGGGTGSARAGPPLLPLRSGIEVSAKLSSHQSQALPLSLGQANPARREHAQETDHLRGVSCQRDAFFDLQFCPGNSKHRLADQRFRGIPIFKAFLLLRSQASRIPAPSPGFILHGHCESRSAEPRTELHKTSQGILESGSREVVAGKRLGLWVCR